MRRCLRNAAGLTQHCSCLVVHSKPLLLLCSTEKKDDKLWVHDGSHMVLRDISFTPGLYKIFDEILVNAADNKVRDPSMDMLKVDIDVVSTVMRPRLAAACCRASRCPAQWSCLQHISSPCLGGRREAAASSSSLHQQSSLWHQLRALCAQVFQLCLLEAGRQRQT